MSYFIDLNADLGEGYGAYSLGHDEKLLELITSASLACGWHGGDPVTMARSAAIAADKGVAVGAHPGYPDLMGFGRRNMQLSAEEIESYLLYQLGALEGICRSRGTRLCYVKPHGAMYNMAWKDLALAKSIVKGIKAFSPDIYLLCPDNSSLQQAAIEGGIRHACEFFADREYGRDGSLLNRSMQGAVISDPSIICSRIIQAVKIGTVSTGDSGAIRLRVDSICLHGDNPSALSAAEELKRCIKNEGIQLRAFADSRSRGDY